MEGIGRGKKVLSSTVANEEILQEESSQAHRGNATIWLNHRMMRAAIKNETMVLPGKICKITWIELAEKCGGWIQCDICDEYIRPRCYGKRDISADLSVLNFVRCLPLWVPWVWCHRANVPSGVF